MDDELLITEDNYKGYIELYNIEAKNTDKFRVVNGIFSCVPIAFYILIIMTIVLPISIFPITLSIFLASEIGMITYYKVMSKKIKDTSLTELKQKYPYVNENVSFESLLLALTNANILKEDIYGRISYYKIDKEEYERNLKKQNQKSRSEQVMDEFMQKLEDNHFDISEPQIGEEFNPTPEFIEKTISNYQKLLKLGLISSLEEDISEEKGSSLVKKKSIK